LIETAAYQNIEMIKTAAHQNIGIDQDTSLSKYQDCSRQQLIEVSRLSRTPAYRCIEIDQDTSLSKYRD
jgi:hypothetical protein